MTSSTDNAGTSRSRTLLRGIATGALSRVISAVSPLVMVPLALGYMGTEAYAIWTAALSLTAMAVFADLGLGQGLMTLLTPLITAKNWPDARRLISTSYISLIAAAVLSAAAVVVAGQIFSWAGVLGFPSSPLNDAIASACILFFLANIPLSLIVRVKYANHEVAPANAWQAGGAIAALLLACLAVVFDLGPLLVVIGALSGPPLANVLASILFYRRNPQLRPTIVKPTKAELTTLLKLGTGFLSLNVIMAAAVNLDVLMISHLTNATTVVVFGLCVRIFSQLGAIVGLANAPLWPLNADAIARGEWGWVRSITRRMTIASVAIATAPSVILVLAGPPLFKIWTGEDLDIPRTILIGAALYWTLIAAISPRFMVQNSVGVLRPQLLGWLAFLCISAPLKLFVIQELDWRYITLVSFGIALVTVLPGALAGYRTVLSNRQKKGE